MHSPLLVFLAIMDYIAVSSYRKKRPPPWKIFFIPLVVVNVIFFSLASWGLSQSGGGVAAPLITVIALILLIIDSVAVLSYIHMHLTHRKAKVILYTVLASIIFGLIALGIFVLGFILSAHS
jgi:hypothetical protein